MLEQSASGTELKRRTTRHCLAVVAQEPFVHFLLIGSLIWSGIDYWNAERTRYTIHIGTSARERMVANFLQQYGQAPSSEQLRRLIDDRIRDEIFLREGVALNLEKDDEVVRRRIIEKYAFLQTDLEVVDPPAAGVLERWFEKNKQRYGIPERVAFSQVYFSADKEGDETAKTRALKVLEELREEHVTRAPDLGDVFPGPSDVGGLPMSEVRRFFGPSDLATELFKLPVNQWVGPYRSSYGWHLLYVTQYWAPELQPLSEVHDRVLAGYLEEQRRIFNARRFETLRAKYTIRYDGAGQ